MLPVLIIGYRRSNELRRVLENLLAIPVGKFYVAMDGPKSSADLDQTSSARDVVESLIPEGCDCFFLYSDVNLGLSKFPPYAIDWFFSHEQYGLIIEDDIVLSPQFINFASHYLTSERVPLVSACVFRQPLSKVTREKPFFSPIASIWGWGASADLWHSFRSTKNDYSRPLSLLWFLAPRLGLPQALIFSMCLFYIHLGKLSTWDYQFAFFLIRNNILCLFPPDNMAINIGNSSLATNSAQLSPLSYPLRDPTHLIDLIPASTILIDYKYLSTQSFNSKLNVEQVYYSLKGLLRYFISPLYPY